MVNLFSREHNKRTRFTRMCIGEAVFVLMDKKEYEDTFKNFRVAYNHVPVYNTQNREK